MRVVLGAFLAALTICSAVAQFPVQMSVLPAGRSAAPNEDVTFLATIVNSSDLAMTCQPRFGGFFTLDGGARGQGRFFTFDGTDVGNVANGQVTIPAGGRQDYLVVIDVDRETSGGISVPIRCTDENNLITDIPRLPLVNDFRVRIASGNQPDIIMIGDTQSADGVARAGETGPRTLLMTVAAINIGDAGSDLVVTPDLTGFSMLNRNLPPQICEIDAQGTCLSAEGNTVSIANWASNEVRLFAVRVRMAEQFGIPFYPDLLRLRVGVDAAGVAASDATFSTSVATDGHARQGGNFLAPIQQCATQPDGDVGYAFAREGGVITLDQSVAGDGSFSADGYLHISQFQFERRLSDYLAIVLEGALSGGSSTLTALGTGEAGMQQTDLPVDVSVSNNTAGGLRLSWSGGAPVTHDLGRAGRTRCVPVPRPETAVSTAAAGLQAEVSAGPEIAHNETADCDLPNSLCGEYNVSRFARDGQNTPVAGLSDDKTFRRDWGDPSERDDFVANAFAEFFRTLARPSHRNVSCSVRTGAIIDVGQVVPHVPVGGIGQQQSNVSVPMASHDGPAECVVVMLREDIVDGEVDCDDNNDAVLAVFVRSDSDLTAQQCIP